MTLVPCIPVLLGAADHDHGDLDHIDHVDSIVTPPDSFGATSDFWDAEGHFYRLTPPLALAHIGGEEAEQDYEHACVVWSRENRQVKHPCVVLLHRQSVEWHCADLNNEDSNDARSNIDHPCKYEIH